MVITTYKHLSRQVFSQMIKITEDSAEQNISLWIA